MPRLYRALKCFSLSLNGNSKSRTKVMGYCALAHWYPPNEKWPCVCFNVYVLWLGVQPRNPDYTFYVHFYVSSLADGKIQLKTGRKCFVLDRGHISGSQNMLGRSKLARSSVGILRFYERPHLSFK